MKRTLATEKLQEWLSVSVMHDCLTGIDGLYNSLLLGAVNDSEDLAASVMNFVCGTRSSMLAGLSCTKGVWYIYDWDTGSTILIW